MAPHKEHSYHMWNHPPGALDVHTSFSTQMPDFPFYYGILGIKPGTHFTAVIMAVTPARQKSGKLFKLIETINLSEYVDQVGIYCFACDIHQSISGDICDHICTYSHTCKISSTSKKIPYASITINQLHMPNWNCVVATLVTIALCYLNSALFCFTLIKSFDMLPQQETLYGR